MTNKTKYPHVAATVRRIFWALAAVVVFVACDGVNSWEDDGECSGSDIDSHVESGGLLIVEAESATVGEGWHTGTSTPGFTGTAYLEWTDGNRFGEPGNGLMSYPITIQTAGTYRFQWRSRINEGTNSTESNDAWLRFADADDFYGERGDSRVYPRDTGKTPNPNGASADGWFKIYQGRLDQWVWQASTSDHDPHDVFVTFNDPGSYTMEISGRSQGFAIDRIVLYNESVEQSDATDETVSASRVTCD